MAMHIDFSPRVEAELLAIARQNGIEPDEVVKRVVTGELPPVQNAEEDKANENAAIALLESWIEQDATSDPEEIRRAEEELEEFKNNINANRAATGERQVYL